MNCLPGRKELPLAAVERCSLVGLLCVTIHQSHSFYSLVQPRNSGHVSSFALTTVIRHEIVGGFFLCKLKEIILCMNYTFGTLCARGSGFPKVHENVALISKVPRIKTMLLWLVRTPLMARGLLTMVLKLLMASFWIFQLHF